MNNSFEIESGVPLPFDAGARWHSKYPFRKMAIGESFLISDRNLAASLRSASYVFSRRHPEYKFTVRVVEDGIRIWRVAVNGEEKK